MELPYKSYYSGRIWRNYLNLCDYISPLLFFDVRKYAESDIMCVRDHYPDPFYSPVINRLQ